jgi:TetR/AcrR family transcriptional regulator, mexJK operon transcriptional repressor
VAKRQPQRQRQPRSPQAISPRGSTKREAILKAARGLFLEHGFASTSVDAVTEASRVSKPTVYSHFPTKEALLEAVVRAEADRLDEPVEFRPSGDPRHDLERVAQALTTMALSPETQAWDRMMAGEARRKPDLGRVFFDCGPRRTVTVLAEFFRALAAKGGIEIPNPEQAADFFFGLVVGLPLLRAQLTGGTDTPRSSQARCREAADRFLRAYAPDSSARKR